MEALSFVSIDVWTILFTWINLAILSLLLKKLLLKPVAKILEQRDQEVRQMYDQAEDAKRQAQALQEQYQEKMAKAGQEASDLLLRAEKTAQKKEEAVLAGAREKAGRMIRDGQEAARLEQEKQKQKNREQMADLAVLATEQILRRELTGKDYESWVQQTIDELGDAS